MTKLYKTYSFDVFDTCLSRLSYDQIALFYLIGIKIKEISDNQILIYEFINARIRAEKTARKILCNIHKQDISINEIYSCFSNFTSLSTPELIKLEIETEESILRPINYTKERIAKIHESGMRVVFISDMYLSSSFIKRQLQKHGFWSENDSIYVSNEIGLTKSSGDLYDYIKEKEDIQVKNWIHYGDNKDSDYLIPKKKGIKSYLIESNLNRYEQSWIESATLSSDPTFGVLMAGIARSIRLSSKENEIKNVILNVIAPLFIPFVAWILNDAQKRNIDKLYFLSRDGYLFFQIAQIFKHQYPQIELKYLYGSRRTFYFPGLKEGTLEEFRWIMGGAISKTPRQMMNRINVDVSILETSLQKKSIPSTFYDEILNNESFELFLELLSEYETKKIILELAGKQKEKVSAYLKQEGLFEGISAIVDLGWSRTCQASINSILDTNRIYGYYFGVFHERMYKVFAGDYNAGFCPEEIYWSDNFTKLFNDAFVPIAEHIFTMTDQGSTIDYKFENSKIVPVFAERENCDYYANLFHDNLYVYAKEFAEEFLFFDELMKNPKPIIKNCGFNSISIFLKNPQFNEAKIFNGLKVGNNLNDNETIIKDINILYFWKIFKAKIGKKKNVSLIIWKEGSYCYSLGKFGLALLHFLNRLSRLKMKFTLNLVGSNLKNLH